MSHRQSLAELMGHMGNYEESDTETADLTDAQIIGRLKSIHELSAEKHTFTPGQIILHRFPDLADTRWPERPRLFIRYLDRPYAVADHPETFNDIRDWGSNITSRIFDCVTAAILDGDYSEHLVESKNYRPATVADFGPIITA